MRVILFWNKNQFCTLVISARESEFTRDHLQSTFDVSRAVSLFCNHFLVSHLASHFDLVLPRRIERIKVKYSTTRIN